MLNAKNVAQVNSVVLQTLSKYAKAHAASNLLADDVQHITTALAAFNASKRNLLAVITLQNALIMQDTLVREYFNNAINVLDDMRNAA